MLDITKNKMHKWHSEATILNSQKEKWDGITYTGIKMPGQSQWQAVNTEITH